MAKQRQIGSKVRRGRCSYCLRVYMGTVAGKRRYCSKTIRLSPDMSEAAMEREAQRQLVLFVADVEQGRVLPGAVPTLEAFSREWMEYHVRPRLSPTTAHRYERELRLRILPALGHLRMDRITPRTLAQFYDAIGRPGGRLDGAEQEALSGTSVQFCHKVLSAVLKTALRWNVILSNPAERMEPPRKDTREMQALDIRGSQALIQALRGESVERRAQILLAVMGGLRRGEIAGLEWGDVDFDTASVHIRRSSVYVPKVGILTRPPKSAKGVRTLTLDPLVMELLREHRADQDTRRKRLGSAWKETGRVFTTGDGAVMHPDEPSRWWRRFRAEHGMEQVRFHDLRHTNATLLIAAGVDPKTVSTRLGHSQISITMDLYAHPLAEKDAEAARRLGSLVRGSE